MSDARVSRGDVLSLIAVLAAAGVADAAYLTYEWYVPATFCDLNPVVSCTAVRESVYSSVGGIPVATIGLVGFLILLGLAVAALRGVDTVWRWPTDRWLLLFAVFGALAGLVLTLIEVFVIRAICILCALGFALDLGVLALAALLPRTR